MSEVVGIDVTTCTDDPNTCPVVSQIMEADAFCSAVEAIDPDATEHREVLGKFVTSCVNGSCIGRNPGLARYMLRESKDDQDDSKSS